MSLYEMNSWLHQKSEKENSMKDKIGGCCFMSEDSEEIFL